MTLPSAPVSESGGARTLTARSVVASIMLPLDHPALPARALVRACELFGISEGATRVALSRMVAAGELHAESGSYRLAGAMLERRERQLRARRPPLDAWTGHWLMVVVTAERRDAGERAAFRRALANHRLGEVRSGVWTRPDNLHALQGELQAVAPSATRCQWFRAELVDIGCDRATDAALAASLWDLAGWASEAHRLVGALEATVPALLAGASTSLAPCFTVAAAAVRHITADPLLPDELISAQDLVDPWPGQLLRQTYDGYETAYRRLLAASLREIG